MNFATMRIFAPQRSKLVCVWLTHESGLREMRHKRLITRPPSTRPAMYQTLSPITHAATARPNNAMGGRRPAAASAPARTSVGSTGIGKPS